jgi:hypothetical protein
MRQGRSHILYDASVRETERAGPAAGPPFSFLSA